MTTSIAAAKYFPLIMTAFSVLRTLAGEKTQTRRIVSASNSMLDGAGVSPEHFGKLNWRGAFVDGGPSPVGNPGPYLHVNCGFDLLHGARSGVRHRVYPRVQVGDRFWVRESFAHGDMDTVIYRADASEYQEKALAWCPPIFMPRVASRIELEVSEIRGQRVQEISYEDARAEGLEEKIGYGGLKYVGNGTWFADPNGMQEGLYPGPQAFFACGWDALHGLDAWKRNDRVWVYTYRRVKP